MTPTAAVARSSKALHIALWIVQVLAAVAFLMAGVMKTTEPVAELAKQMNWIAWFPDGSVRLVGAAELLGGLGLLLPSILRIKPILTPIAALCLTVLMLGAAVAHVMHDDAAHIAPSLVLAALAAFVAWGRFFQEKIAPR